MGSENMRCLSRAASRKIDEIAIQEYGIPGVVLMENAGRNCASEILKLSPSKVAVLCGTGNNGGDGFVLARHLAIAGVQTKVIVCGDQKKIRGDAAVNFEILKRSGHNLLFACSTEGIWDRATFSENLQAIEGQKIDCVVDCLLGTGATGNPRPPVSYAIEAANSHAAKRVAIDIPSGLDCDTGICETPTFVADLTLTMVARKRGFESNSAKPVLGGVQVIDIGIPFVPEFGIENEA